MNRRRSILQRLLDRAPDALPHNASLAETTTAAQVVVPEILRLLKPTSVIDIGCGTGAWLAAFATSGISDYLGLDAPYVREQLRFDPSHFVAANLTEPVDCGRRFDLAMSLEVAEHLSSDVAPTLVASLTHASDLVVFSAAVPGQNAPGHVNLRWPIYWSRLFARHGYLCADPWRLLLWTDDRVAYWYRQNLLVFGTAEALAGHELTPTEPLSLGHPELVEALAAPRPIRAIGRELGAAVLRRIRASRRPIEAAGVDAHVSGPSPDPGDPG